jgi:hypothetical protein
MHAEMPYRKYTGCNIPNILRSLGHQVNKGSRPPDRGDLTTNAISVSGFNPFFNTATPIDPIKPSKFSRKKPGWRILPQRHVSAIIPLELRPIQSLLTKLFTVILDIPLGFMRPH